MNQLPDWLRRAFSATQPPALAPYCVGEYRRHTFRGAATCERCGARSPYRVTAPEIPRVTIYVAPGGDDTSIGTSPAAPLVTLAEAFERAAHD